MNGLAAIHAGTFWLAVAGTGVLLGVVLVGATRRRRFHVVEDRLLIGVFAATALGALSGLALLATGARPVDPLHLLYAAAAPVVLAVARWRASPARPGRAGLWLGAGAAVALGVLFRLWTTGG